MWSWPMTYLMSLEIAYDVTMKCHWSDVHFMGLFISNNRFPFPVIIPSVIRHRFSTQTYKATKATFHISYCIIPYSQRIIFFLNPWSDLLDSLYCILHVIIRNSIENSIAQLSSTYEMYDNMLRINSDFFYLIIYSFHIFIKKTTTLHECMWMRSLIQYLKYHLS